MEQVFGKIWFQEKQKLLLWLLNTPLIKIWFRWVLRIRKCDLPYSTRILEIGPNFFTHSAKLKGDQVELQTSFRSNEKYARRLWFAFEPIWWMFHAWDWVIGDRILENKLSFGFTSLPTVYSVPGTTVSGYAGRNVVDETFAVIRAGAGSFKNNDTGSAGIRGRLAASGTTNQFTYLERGFMLFDTSGLSASATVTVATIGLYGSLIQVDLGTGFEIDVVASTPASNTVLANGDYGNVGTTPFSSVAYASLATSAYNSFGLNANGIANISLTAISKFGLKVNWDTDNNFTGTWADSSISGFAAHDGGAAGTTQDPKIDITYTLPATGYPNLLLLGVG